MKPIRDRQIAAARHGLFNVGFRMVPVFPPSPFVFRVGPACGFKGSCGLVDCASPQFMRLVACVVQWWWSMMQVARDLFKMSLYLFRGASLSRWPLGSSPYSTVLGWRWSSILETCPAQQSCVFMSMPSMLVRSHSNGCLGWSMGSSMRHRWRQQVTQDSAQYRTVVSTTAL